MIENPERICIPSNRIGAGMYRVVYKDPDSNFIVKEDKTYGNGSSIGNNRAEWKTYQFLRDNWPTAVPDYVKIPVMALVDGYIVAEFVQGYAPHYEDEFYDRSWRSAVKETGLFDMHPDNVLVDDQENIWIVDLGHGSWLDS
jgi:hypothetical protein